MGAWAPWGLEMELGEHEFLCSHGDDDWWQVGMRACTLAMLPDGLEGSRALDLGAGCGYVVRDLRRRGIDAEGVELSPYAVERSADIGMESHLRVGRLQDALDTTSDLGLITCLDVLPHREVDEREVLASAARRLRPGGLMLLRVPAYQRLYGHHGSARRAAQLRQHAAVRHRARGTSPRALAAFARCSRPVVEPDMAGAGQRGAALHAAGRGEADRPRRRAALRLVAARVAGTVALMDGIVVIAAENLASCRIARPLLRRMTGRRASRAVCPPGRAARDGAAGARDDAPRRCP